jgi:hypothetical protein
MTPRKQCLCVVLRPHSRSYARAPEVCPLCGQRVHEHAVVTRLQRLDRLDRALIITTHVSTGEARTIQRP